MYRTIGRLRAGESYRVAAPLAIVSIAGDAEVSYAPWSCAASVLLVGAIVSTAEDAEVSYDPMDGVADEVSVIAGGEFTGGSMSSEHRELRVAVRVTAANAESCRVYCIHRAKRHRTSLYL